MTILNPNESLHRNTNLHCKGMHAISTWTNVTAAKKPSDYKQLYTNSSHLTTSNFIVFNL